MTNPNTNTKEEPLGVLEFCAALNSQDALKNPQYALSILHRFVTTVQHERAISLPKVLKISQHDMDMHYSCNKNMNRLLQLNTKMNTKKREKNGDTPKNKNDKISERSWMEDTNDYNVPFVGTAMSKGSTGTIVPNTWPCGLLKEYLTTSPALSEMMGLLLHDSFGKGWNADQICIVRAALYCAVAEVLSAFSFSEYTKQTTPFANSDDEESLSIMNSIIMRKVLPLAVQSVQVLAVTNAKAKLTRTNNGITAGDGSIYNNNNDKQQHGSANALSSRASRRAAAACALDVLSAMVRVGNKNDTNVGSAAALSLRVLTSLHSMGEDYWPSAMMSALRPPNENKNDRTIKNHKAAEENGDRDEQRDDGKGKGHSDDEEDEHDQEEEEENDTNIMIDDGVRISALEFVCSLIDANECRILSSIALSGKGSVGPLYLSLRVGLTGAKTLWSVHYCQSVVQLLRKVRLSILLSSDDRESSKLTDQEKIDLVGGDALDKISRLASNAPLLSASHNDPASVLAGCDSYDDDLGIYEQTAVEARRIIYLLLADRTNSPFLSSTQHRSNNKNQSSWQKLFRALLSSMAISDLPARDFILTCTTTSKVLLPILFKVVTVSDIQDTIESISTHALVRNLMLNGPSAYSCYTESQPIARTHIGAEKASNIFDIEYLLLCTMPSSLGKSAQTKAILQQNDFIVYESLKMIIVALKRLGRLLQDINDCEGLDDQKGVLGAIEEAALQRLPDVQSLLSVRSKYDFYSGKNKSSTEVTRVVGNLVLESLTLYGLYLSRSIDEVKFDWMKILPPDVKTFYSIPEALQFQTLYTAKSMLFSDSISEYSGSFQGKISTKHLKLLVTIMLTSQSDMVHRVARKLLILVFVNSVGCVSGHHEVKRCIAIEAMLWLDNMNETALAGFVNTFEKVQKNGMHYLISAAGVVKSQWNGRKAPGLCFSPFFIASFLSCFDHSTTCPDFQILVSNIASYLLRYHLDPLPIAIFIVQESKTEGNNEHFFDLRHVAEKIVGCYALDKVNGGGIDVLSATNRFFKSSRPSQSGDVSNLSMLCIEPNGSNTSVLLELKQQILTRVSLSDETFIPEMTIRQCLHHLHFLQTKNDIKKVTGVECAFHDIIRSSLLFVLSKTDHEAKVSALHSILGHAVFQTTCTSEEVVLLMTALSSTNGSELLRSSDALQEAVYKYSNGFREIVTQLKGRRESITDDERDRLIIAFVGTSTKYLPTEYRESILLTLLDSCFASLSVGGCQSWDLALLLSVLRINAFESSLSKDLFQLSATERQIFVVSWRLWMLAVPMIDQGPIFLSLIPQLESHLVGFLQHARKNGTVGSILLDESSNMEPTRVVDLCISSAMSNKQSILLSNLLRIDCCMFAKFVLHRISQKKTSVMKLLKEGVLDDPLAVLFEKLKVQQCANTCDKNDFKCAFEAIIDHATKRIGLHVSSDENLVGSDDFSKLIQLLTTIYSFKSVCGKLQSQILSSMIVYLTDLVNKSRSRPTLETEFALLDSSFVLQHPNNGTQNDEAHSQMQLRSLFLVHLCMILPRSLRKRGQRKACGKPLEHDPTCILDKLISVLSLEDELDTQMLVSESRVITNAIVSCLKNGVIADDDAVSAYCLRVIRAFLTAAQITLTLRELVSTDDSIMKVSNIYSMITSHSQFSAALNSVSGNASTAVDEESQDSKLYADAKNKSVNSVGIELLQLLLYCVSMGKGAIIIDRDTQCSLLAAYSGGTRSSDRYIRRILFINESNTLEKREEHDSMPYADAISWGNETNAVYKNARDDSNNDWKWLLKYLESRRVRLTLIQIPFSEELLPVPEVDVEVWENNDSSDFDAGSGSEDEEGSDDYSAPDASGEHCGAKRKSPKNTKNGKYKRQPSSSDDWVGSGEDQRYSLSGMIPLVLGALEAFLPTEPEDDNDQHDSLGRHGDEINKDGRTTKYNEMPLHDQQNKDNLAWDMQYESFAEVARRLSERGGIALCIAALSSKCPDLRRIAVVTIGLFLRAIRSREAHNLSQWNVRPQLEMFLNSMQRGLVLRRAGYTKTNDAGTSYNDRVLVPMLPPVTALFLARASLILSKPGDHLYPAMNAYFLRIADNHGAFKEVTGLPGFMSLYCSSDANHEHNKEERIWALQLLKDGVKDGYSFRIVSKKHVPSLLLTSFEILSVNSSDTSSEGERKFILETLQSMLENCGPIASTHFLMRVGILSWLKGFLVGDDFRNSLPTVFLRCSFFDLCSTAVRSSILFEVDEAEKSSLIFDASELASPLMFLCVETISELRRNDSLDKSESFLKAACNFFRTFNEEISALNRVDSMCNSGIVLQHSVMTISFIQKLDSLLAYDLIQALALLPVATHDTDVATAKEYIILILKIFLNNKRDDEVESQNNVLKHVASLARFYGNDLVDKDIVNLILACRRLGLLAPDGHRIWIDCLRALLGQYDNREKEDWMEIDSDEMSVLETSNRIINSSAW